jgi:hypothetical protein
MVDKFKDIKTIQNLLVAMLNRKVIQNFVGAFSDEFFVICTRSNCQIINAVNKKLHDLMRFERDKSKTIS